MTVTQPIQKQMLTLHSITCTRTHYYYIHTPEVTKRVKGRKCPWLTYEIKTLMNTRDKVLRKTRKTDN